MRSAIETTDTMTLVIPDVASIPVNSYAPLMIQGVEIPTDSITLMTEAHGTMNAVAPLMIKQNTASLNSYINLYVMGAFLDNDNITLALPDVVDDSPTNSIPLYVFGW
jgi:hypothetical protein